ncbi:MAG: hypothetical protein HOV97_04565 [Nonomuraea sp.]|nr:hypothetical protein [Nonomuraea sp.]
MRLRTRRRPRDDVRATTDGITRMQAEIADIRTEMRQDFAALGDELAALRRHLNDHFTTSRPRCCKDQALGHPPQTSACDRNPIVY